MLTAEFKQNIIPYIGESLPYVFIPEKITINSDNQIETDIRNYDFKNANFTNLTKILSSLGSSNLYKQLKDSSGEKIYFLGEKLRIRKISYTESDSLSISCYSYLESKRKGKSFLNVKDLVSKDLLYSFELDYYIISKMAFENIYKDYFDDTPIEFYDETLPESKIDRVEDSNFSIMVKHFTPNQCEGHFDKYPVVPAVFITNCILREIFNFLGNDSINEVDSLEMYLSKAMPTGKEFIVSVAYENFLRDITNFKCEVKDEDGIKYGTYIINIKSKS